RAFPGRGRRLALVGLAGPGLALTLALFGPRPASAFWAGTTFLLTLEGIGLAALGTACGRGRRRAAWLGAALFGGGYMFLVFGGDPDVPSSSRLLADQFLNSLRPWLPASVR